MFSSVLVVVGVVGVLVVLYALVGKTTISRLIGAFRAQTSKVGREAENFHPIETMQDRRDQAAARYSEAVKVQCDCRGHLETIARQCNDGVASVAKLKTRLDSAINIKDTERQLDLAVQLKREEEQL